MSEFLSNFKGELFKVRLNQAEDSSQHPGPLCFVEAGKAQGTEATFLKFPRGSHIYP